jgi:predicted transcriptional regulator
MAIITIAAPVDAVLDNELQRLARATGRTKCQVIADALVCYVAAERQFIDDIDGWDPDDGLSVQADATLLNDTAQPHHAP